MGNNLRTVILAGTDGTESEVTVDGDLQVIPANHVEATIQVATKTQTVSTTDNTLISAPGSSTRLVVVGYVIVMDAEAKVVLHWGTGLTNPLVDFDYITGGGIAYHFGAYGLKGGDNEALMFDLDTNVNVKFTIYYYTEPV